MIGQNDNVSSGEMAGCFLISHIPVNERNPFPVWRCGDQFGRKIPVFPGLADYREPEVRMCGAHQIEGRDKVF